MANFFRYLMIGLGNGAIYAMLGLGLVVIYRSTGLLNFAQGELAMFVTFIVWSLQNAGIPLFIAMLMGVVAGFVIGAIVHRMIIAPVGDPHESGHVHRLRDHDGAVRELERQRAVLHVDDDELEAGHREHLERLEARELHPRAERRRTGSSQPLGNSSHGIGYSSAFSTQPGRSEKSTRGGAKMSIS